MSAIEEVALSLLTTNELSSLGSSFVSITEPLQSDAFIARVAMKIMHTVEAYGKIPSSPQGKEVTESIQKLDKEIDRTIPMLETTLKTNIEQAAFFPEKAEASKEMLKAFDICDRQQLFYGTYADQEAQLNKLFAHALVDSMMAHRDASGTAPIWDALKDWNEKLRELLEVRYESGKLDVTSKDVRRELKYRIAGFLSYLEMGITDEIDGFAAVQAKVNKQIVDVMGKVRARKTRKENEEQVSETVVN